MTKTPRQIIREYFDFSKKDRNAVITLAVIILFVSGAYIIIDNIHLNSGTNNSAYEIAMEKWQKGAIIDSACLRLFEFDPNTVTEDELDSLSIPRFIKKNLIRYRSAGGRFYRTEDLRRLYGMNDSIYGVIRDFIKINLKPREQVKKETVKTEENMGNVAGGKESCRSTFDPNSAGRDILEDLGFNNYQISNILKYRDKGGYFSVPSDLMKIYGIDSVFFRTIEKYIRIGRSLKVNSSCKVDDSGISIELNNTDSAELIKLRGIGPVFASRIIRYRELLGGFSSCLQLLEVYNFPEETFRDIRENISVDTLCIKKMRINFAGYNELIRHPYLSKEEVRDILDYKEEHGPFKSAAGFISCGLVDSAKIEKLTPYINFRQEQEE